MSFNNYYPSNQNNSYQPTPQQSSGPQSQSSVRNNSSQLWMGELDAFWDENSIKSIWSSFGFNDVNVKLIKEKIQQGYNAGYCFVEFPSLDIASNALSLNGTKIPNTNKVLKLNWASGGAGNNNHNASSSSVSSSYPQSNRNPNEISIFVGDLAPDVSETILFEFFGTRYSSVSGTKIMTDQVSGFSKGYGFVRFVDELDQQRALVEMQGAILNGRPIRVSTAVPKGRQNQSQGNNFGGRNQQYPNQHQNIQQQHQQHQHQQQQQQLGVVPNAQSQQILGSLDAQYQPPLSQFTDPNNTTVFIGGLSSIVTEDDLRLYFQPFGDITYVKIPIGKGCGFVQYVTRSSAELAIFKMQGFPIGNSRIRLSWGRSNSNPKPQQYKSQPELPILYNYNQLPQQIPHVSTNQQLIGLSSDSNQSISSIQGGNYGVQQIELNHSNNNQLLPEGNESESRLNQLYLAARDGRLDAIDSAANGYIFT